MYSISLLLNLHPLNSTISLNNNFSNLSKLISLKFTDRSPILPSFLINSICYQQKVLLNTHLPIVLSNYPYQISSFIKDYTKSLILHTNTSINLLLFLLVNSLNKDYKMALDSPFYFNPNYFKNLSHSTLFNKLIKFKTYQLNKKQKRSPNQNLKMNNQQLTLNNKNH